MINFSDKTVLITGSTDGLGKALAKRLAKKGATVLLHGRDEQKGQRVLDEIVSTTGNKNISYFNSGLESLQSVRELSSMVLEQHPNLDMLVNNAGINYSSEERLLSAEGYELCFAVNYLAPFLLSHLLLPLLQHKSNSQIINVASGSQFDIDFENVMLVNDYSDRRAYAQSKLALIMLTFTMAGQLKDSSVKVNALHPETRMDTKMVLDKYGEAQSSVEDGVDNILSLMEQAEIHHLTGAYLDKNEQAPARSQAYGIIARDKLYRQSKTLVKY